MQSSCMTAPGPSSRSNKFCILWASVNGRSFHVHTNYIGPAAVVGGGDTCGLDGYQNPGMEVRQGCAGEYPGRICAWQTEQRCGALAGGKRSKSAFRP